MCCVNGMSSFLVTTFFSKCEIIHKENVPLDKPLIVVANHNNQFIDAGVVNYVLPRKGSFIIAEASMHRPIIGDLARCSGAVPVIRPQDRAVGGEGQIVGVNLEDRILTGSQTNFTAIEILEKNAKVDIKGIFTFVVEEVLSDTEIVFKLSEEDSDLLESKLEMFQDEMVHKYKVLPHINQKEVFQAVTDRLVENGCIIIFPEGGSHDQTTLLPLKPGVAVMALGAMKEGVEVNILPVGINYFHPDIFRSRVLVDVGKPFTVPTDAFNRYEAGERREAYQEVMHLVREKMEEVTLNAPNYKTRKIVRTMRRLYQNGVELSADEYLTLYRRFLGHFEDWSQNEDFVQLTKDVEKYLKRLKSLGLQDKSLESLEQSNSCLTFMSVLAQVIFSLIITTILVLLALPGVLLNLPLFLILRRKVRKEMEKALKKSKVKIKALDVAASQKVINTVKYILPMYLLNSIALLLILFFAYERQNPDEEQFFLDNLFWLVPLLLFFVCPLYTIFMSRVMESAFRRYSLLPARFYTMYYIYSRSAPSCLGGKPRFSAAADIRVQRRHLVIQTQDIVGELTANDEEWQQDPIIPPEQMEHRRRLITKHMVDFLQSKKSNQALLSITEDLEMAKLRDMSEEERGQYINQSL